MKYTTIKIGNIITQIVVKTNIKGYTEGIIEAFIPDADNMTDEQAETWIKENNKRMNAICEFLNKNNL